MAFRVVAAIERPTIGSPGWTILPPLGHGAKNVYVSKGVGAADTNSGASPAAPKLTLAAGYAALTDGRGDRLNLRAGDSWSGESFPLWAKSGKNANEPMVVKSYGPGARPIVGGATDGWNTGQAVNHFIMRGIEMRPSVAVADNHWTGVMTLHASNNLLFEDVIIRLYETNITIQGTEFDEALPWITPTDIRFRRCIIRDAVDSDDLHGEGAYVTGCDGLLFEDCITHHNGWTAGEVVPHNTFSHGFYLSNSILNARIINCWTTYAAHDGFQLRCGGTVTGTVAFYCPQGMQAGSGGDNCYLNSAGVSLELSNCLIAFGMDCAANARGWGLKIGNIKDATITDLIVAGAQTGTFPLPLQLEGALTSGNGQACGPLPAVGVNDVVIDNLTVSAWGDAELFIGTAPGVDGVTIRNSNIPEITYYSGSPATPFVLTSNAGELGTSLTNAYYDAMIVAVLARPRATWGSAYETSTAIAHAKAELGIA